MDNINEVGLVHGSMLLQMATAIAQNSNDVPDVVEALVDDDLAVQMTKLLQGGLTADYILTLAKVYNSKKFDVPYSPEDVSVIFQLTRAAFVAGVYYEKRASYRPRSNDRDSN